MEQARATTSKILEEIEVMSNQNYISLKTRESMIERIKAEGVNTVLLAGMIRAQTKNIKKDTELKGAQIGNVRADTELKGAQEFLARKTASKVYNDMIRDWDKMSYQERLTKVAEMYADYDTDLGINILMRILPSIDDIMKMGAPTNPVKEVNHTHTHKKGN